MNDYWSWRRKRHTRPATKSVKLHNAHCPYQRVGSRCDCDGVGWMTV